MYSTELDGENDPAICAMIGASAATTIAGLPFLGPIACSRVGYNEGEYILNPTKEELVESELDLVVAGTRDGVLMVESEASELPEDIMLGAVQFGLENFNVIDKIIELAESSAKDSWVVDAPKQPSYVNDLKSEAEKSFGQYKIKEKERNDSDKQEMKLLVLIKTIPSFILLMILLNQLKRKCRASILKTNTRIDGRDLNTVRDIDGVDLLDNVHGCALFTRGET